MDNVILTEAFKELKLLEEEDFNVNSTEDMEDAKEFIEDDIDVEPVIEIADVYADEEGELLDSYVGKVILECEVCHSKIFEDADKVTIDEEENVANMDQECPFCFSNDGYKVIGQVAPFGQVEEEIAVEEEPVEDIEAEDEIVEESLKEAHPDIMPFEEWVRVRKHKDVDDLSDEEYYKLEDKYDEWVDGIRSGSIPDMGGTWIVEESFTRKRKGKKINESRITRKNRKINESRDSELYSALERAVKTHTDGLLIFSKPGSGVETLISKWAKSKGINIITVDSEDLTELGGKVVADYEKGRANRISTFEEDPESILLVRDAERVQSELLTALKKFLCVVAISYGDISDFDQAVKTHFYTFDFLNESLLDECGDCKSGDCKDDTLDESDIDLAERIRGGKVPRLGDNTDDTFCIEDPENPGRAIRVRKNPKTGKIEKAKYGKDGKIFFGELEEDFKDVSITTDDSHMTMTSDDEGKVTVTTEPIHDEFEDDFMADDITGGDEMIAPLDDETVAEIEGEEEIEEPLGDEEDIDIDIDEFDEEGFDGLGESYLKKVYENVNSFKTTGIREEKNKLYVEGLIGFDSGNKKKTSFIFEAKDIDSKGKIRFIGENKEITRGKKSFTIAGRMNGKKFMCESFNYNYRAKDENGKSTRLYGTIKK